MNCAWCGKPVPYHPSHKGRRFCRAYCKRAEQSDRQRQAREQSRSQGIRELLARRWTNAK